MSNPNYKMEELIKIEDDYLRRKIDEHLRIDRLAKANSQVLAYEVMANDPEYPHPPTEYHIKYFLKSIVAIDENQKPVMGEVHELRIKIPRNFPEQTAESKMLSPTWHPNIKSSGPFIGDICTNHKGFGSLYNLDELIVRIGEYLQYKRYLAEDRKPWPEDRTVAKWVRDFAEPNKIVNKDQGLYIDNYAWNVFFDDVEPEEPADEDTITFTETEYSGDKTDNIDIPPSEPDNPKEEGDTPPRNQNGEPRQSDDGNFLFPDA